MLTPMPMKDDGDAVCGAAEDAARSRAVDWLALVDDGRYAESWDMASDVFQIITGKTQWQRVLRNARTPLGELTLRQFRAVQYEPSLLGAPVGEYVAIQYETTFGQQPTVREIVTLTRALGEWKVSGYFIQLRRRTGGRVDARRAMTECLSAVDAREPDFGAAQVRDE